MGIAVSHHPASGLHHPVGGVRGEDPDVALEGQGQAHTEGVPVDGRDHQFPDVPRPPLGGGGAEPLFGTGSEGVPAGPQVGAGAERRWSARDHHRAHGVVGVTPPIGVGQLEPHGAGEGVAGLRPVEGDGRHTVTDLIPDRVVGHAERSG